MVEVPLGFLDGAVYEIDRQVTDHTKRNPDGFWFSSKDSYGRGVQHQYTFGCQAVEGGHMTLYYSYTGEVVDTGIDFDTAQKG